MSSPFTELLYSRFSYIFFRYVYMIGFLCLSDYLFVCFSIAFPIYQSLCSYGQFVLILYWVSFCYFVIKHEIPFKGYICAGNNPVFRIIQNKHIIYLRLCFRSVEKRVFLGCLRRNWNFKYIYIYMSFLILLLLCLIILLWYIVLIYTDIRNFIFNGMSLRKKIIFHLNSTYARNKLTLKKWLFILHKYI